MRFTQKAALKLIKIYQISRQGKLSPCRFSPSCSEYMAEAITEHGAYSGIVLGTKRILRCRPHGGFGIDLVPTKAEFAINKSHKNKKMFSKQTYKVKHL